MLIILIALVLAAVVAIAIAGHLRKGASEPDPSLEESEPKPDSISSITDAYYLKRSVFSPAERSFFGVLEIHPHDGVTVLCKMRLADFLGVKRGHGQGPLSRIDRKHVDFLFVDRASGEPLLGIELDDASHQREDRRKRDDFVDEVYGSVGLPIIHFPVQAAYDGNEVFRAINERLMGARAKAATFGVSQSRG